MNAVPGNDLVAEARQHNAQNPQSRPQWDGKERRSHSPPPEHFSFTSWQSIQSFLMVIVMAIGGISWGLKLEARIDRIDDRTVNQYKAIEGELMEIKQQIAKGILPITEIRLSALEQDIKAIKDLLSARR